VSFRDLPDWDTEPELDEDVCLACRRGQPGCTCPRSEEDEEEPPPLPGSLDPRDASRRPPALLDPASVLRNRRRTETYIATGVFTWPRHDSPTTQIERNPHVAHP
jgi:hypothetical protein